MTPDEIGILIATEIKNNLKISVSVDKPPSPFFGASVNSVVTVSLTYNNETIATDKSILRLPT